MKPKHLELDLRNEADVIRARELLGLDSSPEKKTASSSPRKSKYGAIPEVIDGQRFASGREAKRYRALKALAQVGVIRDLRFQVSFDLIVNGELICRYIADFVYVLAAMGETVVEDTKGFPTPAYKLKKKLMQAIHGIKIKEV